MKLFIFSDWQEQPIQAIFNSIRSENSIDAVIYGGDNLQRFYNDGENKLEKLAELTSLGKVLAVKGNMDSNNPKVFNSNKVKDLGKSVYEHEDLVFLGLGTEPEKLVQNQEAKMEKNLNHLREQYEDHRDKKAVLISHSPPSHILDISSKIEHKHIGSKAVRKFIEDEQISLTVCGHCHQFGGRIREKDFGTVINIASTENSELKGRYGIIQIDAEETSYELKTTSKGISDKLLELTQVGENRLKQFKEAGIEDFQDICEENKTNLEQLPGVYDWHVDTWIKEIDAIDNGEIAFSDKNEFRFLKDENIVLFDIETKLGGGKTWLIGLYSYREEKFTQLFEKDDEKKLLEDFIEYIDSKGDPTLVYYSNCKFDKDTLRERMIENNLENHTVILKESKDLGIKVQNYLLGGFSESNLKRASTYLTDFKFTYESLDGFDVGHMYSKYLLDGIEPNWEKLLKYNKEDVMSLKAVTDCLRQKI